MSYFGRKPRIYGNLQLQVNTTQIVPIVAKPLVPDLRYKYLDSPTDLDELQCVICLDNRKNCLIKPCKHLSLCVSCSIDREEGIRQRKFNCPICRTPVSRIEKIYS